MMRRQVNAYTVLIRIISTIDPDVPMYEGTAEVYETLLSGEHIRYITNIYGDSPNLVKQTIHRMVRM